jgi:hypothetical protein
MIARAYSAPGSPLVDRGLRSWPQGDLSAGPAILSYALYMSFSHRNALAGMVASQNCLCIGLPRTLNVPVHTHHSAPEFDRVSDRGSCHLSLSISFVRSREQNGREASSRAFLRMEKIISSEPTYKTVSKGPCTIINGL